MTDVDTTKNVYLFTHGRQDLIEKSTNALVANGFSKDKIIIALIHYLVRILGMIKEVNLS